MSKAGEDRTRSLTRREALQGVAAVPAGRLAQQKGALTDESPVDNLARLRSLIATFTAAQEKAWQVREELERATYEPPDKGNMCIGLGPPRAIGRLLHEDDDEDALETALEPYERARVTARDAVIEAPARTLAAVAAKLRWVAQEYTTWFDEELEDEVEAHAGRRVLADLEAVAGV